MKVILCGLMFSEETLVDAYKKTRCGVQMAPHNFQLNLINGFKQNDAVDEVAVINVIPVGSYPLNYKRLLIKQKTWGDSNVEIGYLNLPFIKHVQQEKKIIKAIESKIKVYGVEKTRLLVYHTYEPFLRAAKYLKNKYPTLHISMIATDCVPGIGDMEKYMAKSAVRRGKRVIKLAESCDSFVVLTKYLAEALCVGERPYTVVECIANENQPLCHRNSVSKNRCLYTGSINKEFGICELAEAFSKNENSELWICGDGDSKEYLQQLSERCNRIKYFGFLKSDELQKMRDECDFLINPRRPTGTYTKYSFPSKTAEYMMSGKPVIMYKLEGIPDEYDIYLNYLVSSNVDELKNELERIFEENYVDLADKAFRAREYMTNNKSSCCQVDKIVDVLKSK